MPFDAGSIIARLDLDEAAFNRRLDAAERRADAFERRGIHLKTDEVFSSGDMSQARRRIADLDNQISRDATARMRSSNGSVLGTLMALFSPRQISGGPTAQQAATQGLLGRMFGGGGGGGGSAIDKTVGGGGSNGSFVTRLLSGIGPQILGLGGRATLWTALGGSALGALPALVGGLAPLGIAGVGAGLLGLGAKQLIGTKKQPGQLYDPAQDALKSLTAGLKSAAQPLVDPLKQVFGEIPSLMKSIGPALRQAFAGAATLIQPVVSALAGLAKTVLPLLAQSFRATAPLIGPLIKGLGSLVTGILPGLNTLLRAAAPAVHALSSVFATLGSGIGQMLAAFAPAIKASSVVLVALGKVLGGLFPIVGALAGVFARTLAPIFVQLAGVIRALEPTLQIVGKVLAALAGAILKDLVSAFGALAKLLIGIQPAIKIFATALSQAFNVLENSGVFAVLGNALEAIVPVLAKLINTLVGQLAPILPVLITLAGQFASILANLLAAGLTTILTAVTDILTRFKFLVPLLGILTAAWWLLNVAMDANPIGLVVLAIVALVGAITLLAKHWSQVWGDIKGWAEDAWNFIYNGFGKYLLPLLGPAGLIALGAIELAQHWSDVMNAIQTAAHDLWQWLWTDFGAKIINFFTVTLPDAATTWWHDVVGTWDSIKNTFLQGVSDIIGIMAKLPGPLGAPFREAQAAISGQLNQITGDVGKMAQNVVGAINTIHGKSVALTFGLNLPAGVSYPSRPIKGHKAAGGGVGSAGAYMVGEQGPEIAWLPQGAHVIPAGPTARIMGGMAGGTDGWNLYDMIKPSASVFDKAYTAAASTAEQAIINYIQKNAVFAGIPGGGGATVPAGGGVARWASTAAYALRLLGQPARDLGIVLSQMTTESGGDPTIVNKWDSNWLAGHPSVGLMQVIAGTFDAYAGPFRNTGPFEYGVSVNPLANIYAGLHYAISRYGAGWTQVLGHGHGYANGGPITEPIIGVGASGRHYTFGEHGPEWVQPGGGPIDMDTIRTLAALLQQLIKVEQQAPAATGAAVARALNGSSRRAFYGAQYYTGGA